jgi:hypothetical protein
MAMADLHGIWWMRGVLILLANRLARPRDPLSGRGDLQHPLGSRNALGEICERLLQSRSMMRPSK